MFSVFIFVSLLLFCECQDAQDEFFVKEHSLIRPFFGSSLAHWQMRGDVMSTESAIRLTPDERSKMGGIWNRIPCRVRDWAAVVSLRIDGSGDTLFGDGMAIWYTREIATCPGQKHCTVFGGRDYFVGLGVFIDTYNNYNDEHQHDHPYISAMINNGSLHYDHDTDGTHTEVAGCAVSSVRAASAQAPGAQLKIQYTGGDTLTVSSRTDDADSQWQHCFSVSGVHLPTGFHWGVTAATGDLSDNHFVTGVRVYDLLTVGDGAVNDALLDDRANVVPSAAFFAAPRDHVQATGSPPMSFWKKLLLFVVAVPVLASVLYFSYTMYQQQRGGANSRFY